MPPRRRGHPDGISNLQSPCNPAVPFRDPPSWGFSMARCSHPIPQPCGHSLSDRFPCASDVSHPNLHLREVSTTAVFPENENPLCGVNHELVFSRDLPGLDGLRHGIASHHHSRLVIVDVNEILCWKSQIHFVSFVFGPDLSSAVGTRRPRRGETLLRVSAPILAVFFHI